MAEDSIQESFVYKWLAGLLTALPAQIPQETVSAIFTGCADVHYRHAKIETFIAPYVGNLNAFLQQIFQSENSPNVLYNS